MLEFKHYNLLKNTNKQTKSFSKISVLFVLNIRGPERGGWIHHSAILGVKLLNRNMIRDKMLREISCPPIRQRQGGGGF